MTDLLHILRETRVKMSASPLQIVDQSAARAFINRAAGWPGIGSFVRGLDATGRRLTRGGGGMMRGANDVFQASIAKDQAALQGSGFLGKAAYGLGMGGTAVGLPYFGLRALKGEPPPEVIPAEYNPRSYVPTATY